MVRVHPLVPEEHRPVELSAKATQLVRIGICQEDRRAAGKGGLSVELRGEMSDIERGHGQVLDDPDPINDEEVGAGLADLPPVAA